MATCEVCAAWEKECTESGLYLRVVRSMLKKLLPSTEKGNAALPDDNMKPVLRRWMEGILLIVPQGDDTDAPKLASTVQSLLRTLRAAVTRQGKQSHTNKAAWSYTDVPELASTVQSLLRTLRAAATRQGKQSDTQKAARLYEMFASMIGGLIDARRDQT